MSELFSFFGCSNCLIDYLFRSILNKMSNNRIRQNLCNRTYNFCIWSFWFNWLDKTDHLFFFLSYSWNKDLNFLFIWFFFLQFIFNWFNNLFNLPGRYNNSWWILRFRLALFSTYLISNQKALLYLFCFLFLKLFLDFYQYFLYFCRFYINELLLLCCLFIFFDLV